MVMNPAQLPDVVDLAIRTRLARRGVAHLTFPNDIQVADAEEDPCQPWRRPAAEDRRRRLPAPPGRPADEDLQAAAEVLNAGEQGRRCWSAPGALHARER